MKIRRCERCVLPEAPPHLHLDEEGVCNVCREFAGHRRLPPLQETDFLKLLAKYRGKGRYDCLVMASGGKDSTAALYLMKRRYRMSPLAFTFDHGFESEDALGNVKRAVDALGVDLVSHRSLFMADLFRRIVETGSKVVICHVCAIWYMQLSFETARNYGTPLIVAGWTKGQSARKEQGDRGRYGKDMPEYAGMATATTEFLESLSNDPKYAGFPTSMDEVRRRARKRHKCVVTSPHWYLPGATEDFLPILVDELGWQPTRQSYPRGSTNCALNFLASSRSLEHYGYTHYHVEMSELIRAGLLTRDEALERLEPNFDEGVLGKVRGELGLP